MSYPNNNKTGPFSNLISVLLERENVSRTDSKQVPVAPSDRVTFFASRFAAKELAMAVMLLPAAALDQQIQQVTAQLDGKARLPETAIQLMEALLMAQQQQLKADPTLPDSYRLNLKALQKAMAVTSTPKTAAAHASLFNSQARPNAPSAKRSGGANQAGLFRGKSKPAVAAEPTETLTVGATNCGARG